jgi:hypothetical protein
MLKNGTAQRRGTGGLRRKSYTLPHAVAPDAAFQHTARRHWYWQCARAALSVNIYAKR